MSPSAREVFRNVGVYAHSELAPHELADDFMAPHQWGCAHVRIKADKHLSSRLRGLQLRPNRAERDGVDPVT
jgi:hypothetical protein